jgi:hypothetical protein
VSKILSIGALRSLGTISYGVYLWHWPVNVFLTPSRVHLHGLGLHILHFVTTLAIATTSYCLIERPIRTRGISFGRPVYIVPGAISLAVALVARATYRRPPPPPSLPPPPIVTVESVELNLQPPPFRILFLGDSTANSLGWGLRGLHEAGVAIDLRGQDGCTMLADLCGGPEWARQATDTHPDATLVLLGGAFMHGITVNGEWQKACHRQWDRKFQSTLARRLEDARSPGGKVWAVTVPYPLGVWEGPAIRQEIDCINRSIRKATQSLSDVGVLELAQHLCPKGECAQQFEGATIRPDGVHYAIDGARELSRWVLDQIQARVEVKD